MKSPEIIGFDTGAGIQRRRAAEVDEALSDLIIAAGAGAADLSLVAVGGYGRGELAPYSDVDLLVLHTNRSEEQISKGALRKLLYPLWDAGFQVGHAVVSPADAIARCKGDLHAATSILSARRVAGAPEPFEELMDRRARWMAKDRRSVARQITEGALERRARRAYAGWSLAPDLKEDIGGLRDLHAMGWLAGLSEQRTVPEEARRAGETLLSVREALHAEVPRRTERIRIDLQPRVARRMGLADPDGADALMERVHSSARTIEWTAEVFLRSVRRAIDEGPKRSGSSEILAEGIVLQDGAVVADPSTPADTEHGFALLKVLATCGKPVAESTAKWLKAALARVTWTPTARADLCRLLEGEHVEQALRMMDHLGLWPAILPEWQQIRGRAQHDPYHRYTIDGHLFRCTWGVSACIQEDRGARIAADELEACGQSLSPLFLAALLHDIGKGTGEDHSEAGERSARGALTRMGFDDVFIDQVGALIRHHLLLSDTATRRDIDDGHVIQGVVGKVGDPVLLRLLLILSQADGRATGPEAWTAWKASLVSDLYHRVLQVFETGSVSSVVSSTEVETMVEELRLSMEGGSDDIGCRIEPDPTGRQASISLALSDRPGTLARAAGVLALHRMSVLKAQAYTSSSGQAFQLFVVLTPPGSNWDRLRADLLAVHSSRLALE
nr:HD domain-containing protein [Actinomycetota bacterium]